MFYSDDPVADFSAYDAWQANELKRLPECVYCGERVQDDHFYLIHDEVICPDCMESHFRKEIEEYIE